MNKFAVAALAALAAASVTPAAHASVVEGIQLSSSQVFDHFEGIADAAGNGSDSFSFSLDVDSVFTSSILSSVGSPLADLEFMTVDFDGVHAFTVTNGFFSGATISGVQLAAGAPTLNVKYGSTAAGVTYSGNIAIAPATPVPEPATWALMLVGIGAAGYTYRRRVTKARLALA